MFETPPKLTSQLETEKKPEKKLENVLASLQEKEQTIIREMREKLNPYYKDTLFDGTILSLYGQLHRLKEYGFCDQEDIDRVAGLGHERSKDDQYFSQSLANTGYLLKEHEDALLIGGYDTREKMANQLARVKRKRQDAGKYFDRETTDADRQAIRENEEYTKTEDKNVLKAIRDKFAWINNKFPFHQRFASDFPNQELRNRLLGSEDLQLDDVGFAVNYFGKLLDMIDLHEAGAVDLEKMSGSELVNLYTQLVNRSQAPIGELKVATDMKKLRDAYLYGIIGSRDEYLDLVKQSTEKNGLEIGR